MLKINHDPFLAFIFTIVYNVLYIYIQYTLNNYLKLYIFADFKCCMLTCI